MGSTVKLEMRSYRLTSPSGRHGVQQHVHLSNRGMSTRMADVGHPGTVNILANFSAAWLESVLCREGPQLSFSFKYFFATQISFPC